MMTGFTFLLWWSRPVTAGWRTARDGQVASRLGRWGLRFVCREIIALDGLAPACSLSGASRLAVLDRGLTHMTQITHLAALRVRLRGTIHRRHQCTGHWRVFPDVVRLSCSPWWSAPLLGINTRGAVVAVGGVASSVGAVAGAAVGRLAGRCVGGRLLAAVERAGLVGGTTIHGRGGGAIGLGQATVGTTCAATAAIVGGGSAGAMSIVERARGTCIVQRGPSSPRVVQGGPRGTALVQGATLGGGVWQPLEHRRVVEGGPYGSCTVKCIGSIDTAVIGGRVGSVEGRPWGSAIQCSSIGTVINGRLGRIIVIWATLRPTHF